MPRKSVVTLDRAYVMDRVRIDGATGCWLWQLSTNPQTGYGQLGFAPYTAHKLAYELWNERKATGVIRHRCHRRRCCNPEHLVEGTHKDNWYDSEEEHRRGFAMLAGRRAPNAVAVEVDGVLYSSIAEAMKALKVSFRTLKRMIST